MSGEDEGRGRIRVTPVGAVLLVVLVAALIVALAFPGEPRNWAFVIGVIDAFLIVGAMLGMRGASRTSRLNEPDPALRRAGVEIAPPVMAQDEAEQAALLAKERERYRERER